MRYGIIYNPNRDPRAQVSNAVAERLTRVGGTVLYILDKPCDKFTPDVILSCGGDGTLLHMAYFAAQRNISVLGINMGTLGYLTELEKSELSFLDRLETGDYTTESRMMLHCTVEREEKQCFSDDVLNDVVISHGEIMRVIPFSFYCDGAEIKSFRADGMVAATPTGSTAYSLSAGGPVVDPAGESLIFTPLNPHALYAHSFVMAPGRTVEIKIGNLENRSALLSPDGRDVFALATGDRIIIQKSGLSLRMIKLRKESFLKALNTKL